MLYALIGVLIFWICFVLVDKLTPYRLWGQSGFTLGHSKARGPFPTILTEVL